MNYKERCKDCFYLFEGDGTEDFTPKGEWCCDCYEKMCKQIFNCPQVDKDTEVKYNG